MSSTVWLDTYQEQTYSLLIKTLQIWAQKCMNVFGKFIIQVKNENKKSKS